MATAIPHKKTTAAATVPFTTPANTDQWAQDLLAELGLPQTSTNISFLSSWENSESGTGYGYNPLGSTATATSNSDPSLKGSQSVAGNPDGVQEYTSWAQGVRATADILKQSNNSELITELAQGNTSSASLRSAVESSPSSWDNGDNAGLSPSTATAFQYGGALGTTKGAPASGASPGFGWNPITDLKIATGSATGTAFESNIPGNTASTLASLSPVQWLESSLGEVLLILFGFALVIVGLVITFRQEGDVAKAATVAAA